MDRFAQGLIDPQEARVVEYCDECGGEVYEGQQVWKVGSDTFCGTKCLLDNLGAVEITA